MCSTLEAYTQAALSSSMGVGSWIQPAAGNDFGLESVSDSFNLRLSCRRGDTSLVGATPADEVSGKVSKVGCLGVAIIKIAA